MTQGKPCPGTTSVAAPLAPSSQHNQTRASSSKTPGSPPVRQNVADVVASRSAPSAFGSGTRFQWRRFLHGLVLSVGGISLLLLVAVGFVHRLDQTHDLALPLVGLFAILGVMMLGGGFGLMATSATRLDEQEFDRLLDAGNISDQLRHSSDDEADGD